MSSGDLNQDDVWVDVHGVAHRLDAMSPDYRRNVVAWLERHAGALRRSELSAAWSFSMTLRGEMALDMMDAEIAALESMTDAEYLADSPLYRRLRELADADLAWIDA